MRVKRDTPRGPGVTRTAGAAGMDVKTGLRRLTALAGIAAAPVAPVSTRNTTPVWPPNFMIR
jgi:hypothetical protein